MGEEKFKKRADGGMNRHVYYHCSRQVDYSCPEPYLREDKLVEELLLRVNEITPDNQNVEPGLLNAMGKFETIAKITNQNFDSAKSFHEYAQYVLVAGTDFEKTRLIRNISTKLSIHNRTLIVS